MKRVRNLGQPSSRGPRQYFGGIAVEFEPDNGSLRKGDYFGKSWLY